MKTICNGLFFWGLISLSIGCNTKAAATDSAEENNEPTLDCSALSVEECSTEEACQVIEGVEVIWGENCIDYGSAVGLSCLDVGIDCGLATTFVSQSSDDTLYRVPYECIPEGWEEVMFEITQECE